MSPAELSAAVEAQREVSAKLTRSASFDQRFRKLSDKAKKKRNRFRDREGAGSVLTRRPDNECGAAVGAAQGDRGSSRSNALLVEVRAVRTQKVRVFAVHSRQPQFSNSVDVSVGSNTTGLLRSGSVTIAGITVTVSQKSCINGCL